MPILLRKRSSIFNHLTQANGNADPVWRVILVPLADSTMGAACRRYRASEAREPLVGGASETACTSICDLEEIVFRSFLHTCATGSATLMCLVLGFFTRRGAEATSCMERCLKRRRAVLGSCKRMLGRYVEYSSGFRGLGGLGVHRSTQRAHYALPH